MGEKDDDGAKESIRKNLEKAQHKIASAEQNIFKAEMCCKDIGDMQTAKEYHNLLSDCANSLKLLTFTYNLIVLQV